MSRLKFVRQGSNWPEKVGCGEFFFEKSDGENEGFGVAGCVRDCKTGFAAFLCKKPPYVCSLSSVGIGDVVRLWVGL